LRIGRAAGPGVPTAAAAHRDLRDMAVSMVGSAPELPHPVAGQLCQRIGDEPNKHFSGATKKNLECASMRNNNNKRRSAANNSAAKSTESGCWRPRNVGDPGPPPWLARGALIGDPSPSGLGWSSKNLPRLKCAGSDRIFRFPLNGPAAARDSTPTSGSRRTFGCVGLKPAMAAFACSWFTFACGTDERI